MKKSEVIKALQEVLREKKRPGLWANIRAKRERGEKPAHKNSNAHKDAVKAGKEINKMSEANINPEAEKLVGSFIMKLAKRYGYGAKDAIYLIQDVISNIEASGKLNEGEGTLNKIADMLSRKFPDLRFDVNTMSDRIDVRGSQQDLASFGSKLGGKKLGEYEVFATDDDDRGEIVRIVKSDSISRG